MKSVFVQLCGGIPNLGKRPHLIQEKTWIAWVSDLHAVGLMVVDSLILANLHWSSVNFREFSITIEILVAVCEEIWSVLGGVRECLSPKSLRLLATVC